MRILIITFFAVLVVTTALSAGQSAKLPADTRRILHVFDFEERALGNDEDQPMNWEKVTSDAFPHYVTGRLSSDQHRSGNYSLPHGSRRRQLHVPL